MFGVFFEREEVMGVMNPRITTELEYLYRGYVLPF